MAIIVDTYKPNTTVKTYALINIHVYNLRLKKLYCITAIAVSPQHELSSVIAREYFIWLKLQYILQS